MPACRASAIASPVAATVKTTAAGRSQTPGTAPRASSQERPAKTPTINTARTTRQRSMGRMIAQPSPDGKADGDWGLGIGRKPRDCVAGAEVPTVDVFPAPL